MASTRPLPRLSGWRRLLGFLRSESAGGFYLILSGLAAMVWANSPAAAVYNEILGASWVQFVVNDGLMTIFFLSVGLALRREMTVGSLASPSRMAAPAVAALGGMILPAIIFSAINFQDLAAMRGWAVPVATDIAFVLAVLSLLGSLVPISLKVFLVALAIIDDLGAIIVIAIFYSYHLDWFALAGAALLVASMRLLARRSLRSRWPYLVGGPALWFLIWHGGVHPTLAGVALAFVLPVAVADRLEESLEVWVAFLILPLFGLVNAGLSFGALPQESWRLPLALGVGLGLILGKQLGVFGAVLLARRLKLVQLPAGVGLPQLYGGAALCGIGFTMSLFIDDLAFADPSREDVVKLAVLAGSVISAAYGLTVLWAVSRERADGATRTYLPAAVRRGKSQGDGFGSSIVTSVGPRHSAHEIDPIFLARWSPRAFTGESIAETELMRIFEAARWAPSSYNSQPWRLIYARRDTPAWSTHLALLNDFNQSWAKNAACLVIVASSETMLPPGQTKAVPSWSHSFDAGSAWGYLALQATMLGWHAHAMVGFDRERSQVELGIPAGFRVEAAIAIGRLGDKSSLPAALQERETPNDRLSLDATTFEGRFRA